SHAPSRARFNDCAREHEQSRSGDIMRRAVVVAATCLAFIATSAVDAAGVVGGGDDELVPTGKGWGERPAPGPGPGQGAGQGQGNPQGQGKPSHGSGG